MVNRIIGIVGALAAVVACTQTDSNLSLRSSAIPVTNSSSAIPVTDPRFASGDWTAETDQACVIVRHENSGGPLTGQPAVSEDEYLCPNGDSYYVTRKP